MNERGESCLSPGAMRVFGPWGERCSGRPLTRDWPSVSLQRTPWLWAPRAPSCHRPQWRPQGLAPMVHEAVTCVLTPCTSAGPRERSAPRRTPCGLPPSCCRDAAPCPPEGTMGTSEHVATSGAACRDVGPQGWPREELGEDGGQAVLLSGFWSGPRGTGPTGPSAHHHQVAGGGCGRLPFADGGQVAPRPVPQGWPGRSGSRRMRPPPSVLLSLLLQNPAHNLVPSELLLLLEGAAGRRRGLGAPPSPGSRVDAWRPGGCQARPQDANPGPRPVPWGVAPAPGFQAGSQGAPTEAHAKAA